MVPTGLPRRPLLYLGSVMDPEPEVEDSILNSSKSKKRPVLSSWGSRCQLWYFLLMQFLLLTVYLAAFLLWGDILVGKRIEKAPKILPCRSVLHLISRLLIFRRPVPAESAVEYWRRYFDKYGYLACEIAKPPSPLLDKAWHDLLEGTHRASRLA